ncbi:hypothetical protein B0T22DRAFT_428231 [Podospora appendiculata]|uniref:Fork-head domain-containing protein n=1 Tax=Podospora appendiculata TaxID=314037 RepID=A0AAE0X494_9PEZI|nr:hypothetical protein B0T22DRAFT_428231 [Podospora appendiculata]
MLEGRGPQEPHSPQPEPQTQTPAHCLSLSQSPAPPAISPLTDPADPGNREPSVNVSLDHEDPEPNSKPDPAANQDGAPETGNSNSHLSTSTSTATATAIAPATAPMTAPAPAASTAGLAPMDDSFFAYDLPPPVQLDDDGNVVMGHDMQQFADPNMAYYNSNSSVLMALAQLSAASQQRMPPSMPFAPSTVRPSQVSLPQTQLVSHNHLLHADDYGNGGALAEEALESFARIEFEDSVFQMTTYAVIIGRDQRALEQARRDGKKTDEYHRRVGESEAQGLPAPPPPIQDRGKFSRSYISEEGGMLGPESDGEDNPRPSKRRKTSGGGSASGNSLVHEAAAYEQVPQDDRNLIFNRQYVSHTPGAAAVNLSALRPSPYHVPFIGIHSPGPNIATRTKAISREHLKIQFNQAEGVFEAIPLHKNGFFCEEVHHKDEKVVLRSGDRLQIKDVGFVFLINGVKYGMTGAEEYFDEDQVSARRYSENGKEMSFEFESSPKAKAKAKAKADAEAEAYEAAREDSQSELSEPGDDSLDQDEDDDHDVMDTIENDGEEGQHIKPEMGQDQNPLFPPLPPKKRGPGRPPKNGIMSKREERLRKKEAMELAKKSMPPPPPGEPPVKRKVGRPRKHPLPEDAPDKTEKRKYKPRKSKSGEEGGEGSDAEKAVKERRREKPKTPPLELKREDYTEEQLQKPNKNYGVLIDEVLTAATDGLTLKQIYKRIQMKYPFYYFTVDTKGWESSVRHNLIGNDAFKKNEETHLWSRVPGIDIDAGKKRKAASPDRSTSMHNFGQHYSSSMAPHPAMFHGEHGPPSQNYHSGSAPPRPNYASHNQASLGQQQQQHTNSISQAGTSSQQLPRQTSYPAASLTPTPAQIPGYGAPSTARPLQAGPQATTYSSPYSTKAAAPAVSAAQPGATPYSMAQQLSHPPSGPSPPNGLPRVDTPSAYQGTPGAVAGKAPPPVAQASSPVALAPAVPAALLKYINNFKKTVTDQLSKITTAAPEAVALSVINRVLGLATVSMVPEVEKVEKIVLGVLEAGIKVLGANQHLHPGLVSGLLQFKTKMAKTLDPKLGQLKAERLIMSAIDRVLGFSDQSTAQATEAEKKEFDNAENVLMKAIEGVVTSHQKAVAAAARPLPPAVYPNPARAASSHLGPSQPHPAPPGRTTASSAPPGPTQLASAPPGISHPISTHPVSAPQGTSHTGPAQLASAPPGIPHPNPAHRVPAPPGSTQSISAPGSSLVGAVQPASALPSTSRLNSTQSISAPPGGSYPGSSQPSPIHAISAPAPTAIPAPSTVVQSAPAHQTDPKPNSSLQAPSQPPHPAPAPAPRSFPALNAGTAQPTSPPTPTPTPAISAAMASAPNSQSTPASAPVVSTAAKSVSMSQPTSTLTPAISTPATTAPSAKSPSTPTPVIPTATTGGPVLQATSAHSPAPSTTVAGVPVPRPT